MEVQWYRAVVLFRKNELDMWKESKKSTQITDNTEGISDLLFLETLDTAMNVSFSQTMKPTIVAVIAMYCLKRHVHDYENNCVSLIGFALVHDQNTLASMVSNRVLYMRSSDVSFCYIQHKDILRVQRAGMSPILSPQLKMNKMGGHVLETIVHQGMHISEKQFTNRLSKWMAHGQPLHVWIMLRYILTDFGGTGVALLPLTCLQQVRMSGINPKGDGTAAAYRLPPGTTGLLQCLRAIERTPSSETYYRDFIRYIQKDYTSSIAALQEIEKKFSEQDYEWERYPVIYTARCRDLWSTLTQLPSMSLQDVETFLEDRLIPKHDQLFAGSPYKIILGQANVRVHSVQDFCLYKFTTGDQNVSWKPVVRRQLHCYKVLASRTGAPSPLLCGNHELKAFADSRQPLFMDSSDTMCHIYPHRGDTVAIDTTPSVASLKKLLVGKADLPSLMKGRTELPHKTLCVHEVTNTLLNISTVVIDVDVDASSNVVSIVRQSEEGLNQFCTELKHNAIRVLDHIESKSTLLEGLANDAKHIIFRTEPTDRDKEGFHHLIVLPEWVCLQDTRVASIFVSLLDATRPCMHVIGQQGVTFDNFYNAGRHPMRLPFQCKSEGKNPLLLVHSDYAESWADIGTFFIHGPRPPSQRRVLIDNITGVVDISEQSEHHRNTVSVLRQKNDSESKQSSFPSILDRYGKDLRCTTLGEIQMKMEAAFTNHIAKLLVSRVTEMGRNLCMSDIGMSWQADKEILAVGKGEKRYMDVCIATPHRGLQSCVYYICIRMKQVNKIRRIYAVLYELCFSTNCVASRTNRPYDTGIKAILA